MSCQSPKILWNRHSFKEMELGDPLPGSPDGMVTQVILDSLLAGEVGEDMRSLIRPGHYIPIDCGRCRSCIFKAVMAKTGAMLCEAQFSGEVAFLTMTYRPDAGSSFRADLADKMLMPHHIRAFRESLRRDPYYGKFRSVIVGEYGDLRGRAHWHCILYSAPGEPLPEFDYNCRSEFKHWQHGHTYAEPNPGAKSFSYVAAYCLKTMAEGSMFGRPSQLHISSSRRPVIGHQGFRAQAERAADFQVPPSFNYMPPGGNVRYNYTMKDRARDLYIDAYLDTLALAAPDDETFSALDRPLMAAPKGVAFRGVDAFGKPDVWMHKAVLDGLRRRAERLNPSAPVLLAQADMADFETAMADRQLRQERLNALDAERRAAAAVQAANERNRRFELSMRSDPSDPFWDELDANRFAASVLKGGSWRDF